ncbi:MAG: hypothetical protein AAFY17_07845 [Cyanobacteria bacterium J06642_11]
MAIVLALLIGVWVATVMLGAQVYSTDQQPTLSYKQSQTSAAADAPQKTTAGRKQNFNNRVPTYG